MVLVVTAVAVVAQLSVFLGPAGGRSARLARVAVLTVVAVDVIGGIATMGHVSPGHDRNSIYIEIVWIPTERLAGTTS